jgi:DNA-binding NarL/FixJ family response regulator
MSIGGVQSDESRGRTRILLVDDHPLVRQGLAQLIDAEPDLLVCGEAGGVRTALEAIRAIVPDLAVVDLTLEDGDGLELVKEIVAERPGLPVLVLSMHNESLYAERVLHAGARGYIMKHEAPEKVLDAIRRVLKGDVYVSERMAVQILRAATEPRPRQETSPVERLSDRELEVFLLIGKGFSSREIAKKLCRSVKTIETHREHIKDKLTIQDANEFRRFAMEWASGDRGASRAGRASDANR